MAVQSRAPQRSVRRGPAVVTPISTPSSGSGATDQQPRQRSFASWVLIGVPSLLGLFFIWQIASGFVHTETVDHAPVGVSSIRLEPDPLGIRVDVVLVDRQGTETTGSGDLTIKLREPDGAVWQNTRALSPDDFQPLPASHLLASRIGYSVLVPGTDWMRAPRRGGSTSVSVTFQSHDDGAAPITRQAEERFP
jgi:hypothetical protein